MAIPPSPFAGYALLVLLSTDPRCCKCDVLAWGFEGICCMSDPGGLSRRFGGCERGYEE
jgi:hypothetical protein